MSSRADLYLEVDDLQHRAKAHRALEEAIRAILRGTYGYMKFRDLLTEEERNTLSQIAMRLDIETEKTWEQVRSVKAKLFAGKTEQEDVISAEYETEIWGRYGRKSIR